MVTLLVIGFATCTATHRNQFRRVSRVRQQPTVAVAPLHQPGRMNRNTAGYRSSDPLLLPVRQHPRSIPITVSGKRITDGGQKHAND